MLKLRSYFNKSLIIKSFKYSKNYMENNQEERPCDNCKNVFPCDKIDLHQAYCFRNIKKCGKCDKMIDINEQQTHNLQQHTNKQCNLCKQQFSPDLFDTHYDMCPKKPIQCEFCQNTYALVQIARHKQVCGSRTQACRTCQRLVMIKQVGGHEQRCQRRRAQQRRVQREVSQQVARNHSRNQIQVPSRERQNSQNVRDRRSSVTKNVVPKPSKVKPSHLIGPQSIKPVIDPVPISIRMAMKAKDQHRLPLKNKNI